MAGIKIKWLGHSCFQVTCGDYSVIFDPFGPGSVPGLRDIHEQADDVFCSHDHFDHNCREAVALPETPRPSPFKVTTLSSFHDDQQGRLRGKNTITILEADGLRVAHMGDIGCMPSPMALEKLSGVDVMLLPVGGHYTVGPKEAKAIVEEAKPKTVIPMHYRSDRFGFDVLGPVEDFCELFSQVTHAHSDTVTISEDTPKGVLVLEYPK